MVIRRIYVIVFFLITKEEKHTWLQVNNKTHQTIKIYNARIANEKQVSGFSTSLHLIFIHP